MDGHRCVCFEGVVEKERCKFPKVLPNDVCNCPESTVEQGNKYYKSWRQKSKYLQDDESMLYYEVFMNAVTYEKIIVKVMKAVRWIKERPVKRQA